MANPNSNSESTPLLDNGNSRNHQNSRRLSTKTARLVVKSLVILLCLATAATVVTVVFQEIKDSRERQGRKGRPYSAVLAKGKKGAVATENPICSEVGLDVLKDDGSAVDAAIASTLCVGVLNMFSSGIGGGGFMIVRSPTACPSSSSKSHCSEHTTIDFRETGPTGSNSTMFKGRPLAARVGGLAVGVPGELRGLEEAHKRWGVLPWERLVKPSIQIAKSSKTSKELERRLKLFGSFMLNDPDWKESFINKDTGSLLVEGDVLKREAYAKTLEKISKNGPGIFYEGEIAKSLVEKVQSKGGILTLKDLKDYKAKVSSALEGSFQGKKVWTTNAPTSGPVLLSLLNILEGFPNYFSKKDGLHSGLNNHLLIESMKFSSAQRTEIADPDFLTPHALKRISEISTKREADLKRSNISFDRTHDTDWYQPIYDVKENHGTMHLSVVDKNGMAVALTSTVNLIFGSQVLDPKTGIILNDEMDDNSIPGVPNAFGLYPSPYNYPAEGKRPLSSMAPSILENSDGSFYLAIGGSGGSRIFPAIGSVLTNLEFGLDLSSAIERPRIHHQLLPPQAQIETGYDEDLIESLKSRGHEILMTDIDWALSEVQAVMKVGPGRKQVVYGASDSRKGGIASAY